MNFFFHTYFYIIVYNSSVNVYTSLCIILNNAKNDWSLEIIKMFFCSFFFTLPCALEKPIRVQKNFFKLNIKLFLRKIL